MFGILLHNRAPRTETFMTALFSEDADDPPEEKNPGRLDLQDA